MPASSSTDAAAWARSRWAKWASSLSLDVAAFAISRRVSLICGATTSVGVSRIQSHTRSHNHATPPQALPTHLLDHRLHTAPLEQMPRLVAVHSCEYARSHRCGQHRRRRQHGSVRAGVGRCLRRSPSPCLAPLTVRRRARAEVHSATLHDRVGACMHAVVAVRGRRRRHGVSVHRLRRVLRL